MTASGLVSGMAGLQTCEAGGTTGVEGPQRRQRQPQGKTRMIKATGNGAAPANVDPVTGELDEQATSPATLPQDAPQAPAATGEPSEAFEAGNGDPGAEEDPAAFWPTDEEAAATWKTRTT